MPVTQFQPLDLYSALAQPDTLDSVRTFLYFPIIPSIAFGSKSEWLPIRCVEAQLPPIRVGQVRVPLPGGHIRAFRGERDHGNTFSAAFLETVLGDSSYMLQSWQEVCASSKDGSSAQSADYGVELFRVTFDTVGNTALAYKLINCWPQQVTPPNASDSSGPARIEVTFSVDWIDLIAGGPMPTDQMLGFVNLPSPAELGNGAGNRGGLSQMSGSRPTYNRRWSV